MKVFRIAIRVFIFLLLFVFSFAAVYPLIFLLGGSLKSTAELGNSLASLLVRRWNDSMDMAAI